MNDVKSENTGLTEMGCQGIAAGAYCRTCGKTFIRNTAGQDRCSYCILHNITEKTSDYMDNSVPIDAERMSSGLESVPQSIKGMPVINQDTNKKEKDYPYPPVKPISEEEDKDEVCECPECGALVNIASKFCPECGAFVKAVVQGISF